ncbi:MAG: phosphotransferase [Pseudomonadota bacterium]
MSMNSAPNERVLADWEHWPIDAKPTVVRSMTGGQNNTSWLLEAAGKHLVLKSFTETTTADRSRQIQQWAAKRSLAPPVLYFDRPTSYLLMEYVEQPTIQTVNIVEPGLQQLSTALAKLHAAPVDSIASIAGRFDLLAFCEQYLEGAANQTVLRHKALLPILNLCLADDNPECLCHNDLVAENCFVDDEGAQFIDWDYAQLNNPWFDLASAMIYWQLDQAQCEKFLGSYREGWDELATSAVCRAAQCTVLWIDLLWYEYRNPSIDQALAKTKLKKLESLAATFDIHLPG